MDGATPNPQPWPHLAGEMAERVRAFDWSATPIGPIVAWPDRLRTMVETVLTCPVVASLALFDERLLIYNDTAAGLYGTRHPGALGRPLADTFADSYPVVAPLYDRVYRGETVCVRAQPLATGTDAGDEVFDAFMTPVRDAAGVVFGAHMIGFEISASLRHEARLRASEERQVFLLKLSDALRSSDDADTVIAHASRLLGEKLDATRVVIAAIDEDAGLANIQRGWTAAGTQPYPASLRLDDFGGPLLDDLRAGRVCRFDDVGDPPYARGDLAALAANGVRAGLSVPLLVGGRFVLNLNVHQDAPRRWTDDEVTLTREVAERIWAAVERARVETALRQSEAKYRALFEAIDEGFCIIELAFDATGEAFDYRIVSANPAFERQTGLADAVGKTFLGMVPDRDPRWPRLYGEVARTGTPRRYEGAAMDRWFDGYAFRLGAPEMGTVAVLFRDITERRRMEQVLRDSERNLRTLVAELQHRVRNILTVIRLTFSRTFESEGDLEELADHFRGRLDAMARTQVALTRHADRTAYLEDLVRDELLSVGVRVDDDGMVTLDGPEVELNAQVAESLAMALHELTTNALKYGALSARSGRLTISWTLDSGEGRTRTLNLLWVEQGVAALSVNPARRGFGRELIEEALPYRLGAETMLEFRGGGLRCVIAIPLGADEPLATGANERGET